jgi:hypothetical protein
MCNTLISLPSFGSSATATKPLRGVNLQRLQAQRTFADAGVWSQYLQIGEINGVR